MRIQFATFKSTLPQLSSLLLPENYAQTAQNLDLRSGDIIPTNEPSNEGALTLGSTIRAISPFVSGGTTYWLRFADRVSVAPSPVSDETYRRVYWSGDSRFAGGEVAYSYAPALHTGGTTYPTVYYKLGIPAPTAAPSVAVSGTPPDNPNEDVRFYVYTYVGTHGEEGPPSPVSDMLSVAHNGASVTVSGLAVPGSVSTSRQIAAFRIYRTVTGTSATTFMFVAEIPHETSSYSDAKDSTVLVDSLETTNYYPPRDGLSGLLMMQNGVMAGFRGRDVCFSEQYLPYAWPRTYEYPMGHDVVAIGAYDYHLIVGTVARPVMITVLDPSEATVQELPITEACISAASMVSMGWCAIYASPNGLVQATASGARLITDGLFRPEQWQAMNPSSIVGFEHEGRYVGFWKVDSNNKGGFIIDPKDPSSGVLTTTDWYEVGARDPDTGKLFLLSGTTIHGWRSGTDPQTATWKSKRIRLGDHVSFSACRVRADDYDNVVCRIYADGSLIHEKEVTGDYAFRLPRCGRFMEWEVEIETTSRVRLVSLAESVTELQR